MSEFTPAEAAACCRLVEMGLAEDVGAGDINNPPLAISDFDPGSRVSLTGTIPIPLGGGVRSTATFYYNGQIGRAYSIVFSSTFAAEPTHAAAPDSRSYCSCHMSCRKP